MSLCSMCFRGGVGLALIAVVSTPGSAGAADTPVCDSKTATIVGTEGPDELVGLPGRDVIAGLGGDDHITGDLGDDYVCGDEGDDTVDTSGLVAVYGGPGNDTISGPEMYFAVGGPGDDYIAVRGGTPGDYQAFYGDEGDDTLLGGSGTDVFYPGLGRDTVDGGAGMDGVRPVEYHAGPIHIDLTRGFAKGQGRDTLTGIENMSGTDYADRLIGDNGPNSIESYYDADAPHDVMRGRGGDDDLTARGGTVHAGSGDDDIRMRYVCCRPGGNDYFDGGKGYDWFRFDPNQAFDVDGAAVTFDLEAGTATGPYVGHDVMLRFEAAYGTSGADIFLGNDADNQFFGKGGDDRLEGRNGDDTLGGGEQSDTLVGGPGTDTCYNGETVTECEH